MEKLLIVQADDFGMTHGCNLAVEDCYKNGILTCTSIMAQAPWAEQAAVIARANPGLCVGAHLATVCEWRGYRWRPVMPYSEVSTLVDENGFLHQSPEAFFARNVDYDQLEREFMAQMDLLTNKWGIELGYVDNHYSSGKDFNAPEYYQVIQRVAAAYKLRIIWELGYARFPTIYNKHPEQEAIFVSAVENMEPGTYISLHHLLQNDPESKAIEYFDTPVNPPGGVAINRAGEADTLRSPAVKAAIEKHGVKLVNYKELLASG